MQEEISFYDRLEAFVTRQMGNGDSETEAEEVILKFCHKLRGMIEESSTKEVERLKEDLEEVAKFVEETYYQSEYERERVLAEMFVDEFARTQDHMEDWLLENDAI